MMALALMARGGRDSDNKEQKNPSVIHLGFGSVVVALIRISSRDRLGRKDYPWRLTTHHANMLHTVPVSNTYRCFPT